MNDTAAWEPPTGRYEVRVGATMLHHLGLGPEPTEDYYAFKCKLATDTTFLPLYSFLNHQNVTLLCPPLDQFRPQSFDVNTPSNLISDPTAKNKFTFIQQSPITVSVTPHGPLTNRLCELSMACIE